MTHDEHRINTPSEHPDPGGNPVRGDQEDSDQPARDESRQDVDPSGQSTTAGDEPPQALDPLVSEFSLHPLPPQVQAALVSRSGPIPDADELARYEHTLPGLANRITQMAEETNHAVNAATLADAEATRAAADSVRQDAESIKRGQQIYFALSVLLIMVSLFFGIIGANAPAIIALLTAVVSSAGALIRPVSIQRWKPQDR